MATPRPKYRALVDFRVGGESYRTGELVPGGRALDVVLRHGETFVRADTARTKTEAPAEDPIIHDTTEDS